MSVSLVELRLESPTILVRRAGRIGYSSISGRIHGSTLRGSIISWAFKTGYIENPEAEMNDPKLIVHPAYPKGRSVARPPTPYIMKCKDGRVVDLLGRENVEKLTRASSVEEMLLFMKDPSRQCHIMRNIPGAAKIIRSPVFIDKEIRVYEEMVDVMASVGINKRTRASERGMLYNYEAILPGAEFSTVIIDRTDRRRYIEFLRRERRIFIGRGISRGFGSVSVGVRWEKDMDLLVRELKDEVKKWVVDGRIALYARSPATTVRGLRSSPIPEPEEGWIAGVRIARGNGGFLAAGFKGKFRSVSYITGLPRPSLSCSEEGTVFIAEVNSEEAVALGSLIGWSHLSCLGLNIIQPLGWWYDDPLYCR